MDRLPDHVLEIVVNAGFKVLDQEPWDSNVVYLHLEGGYGLTIGIFNNKWFQFGCTDGFPTAAWLAIHAKLQELGPVA